MTHKGKNIIILVLFIVTFLFYANRIATLKTENIQLKAQVIDLQQDMEDGQKGWKEYWRIKCGCFTAEEVMDAFTR